MRVGIVEPSEQIVFHVCCLELLRIEGEQQGHFVLLRRPTSAIAIVISSHAQNQVQTGRCGDNAVG